jgi:hypothetical protein
MTAFCFGDGCSVEGDKGTMNVKINQFLVLSEH